MPGTLNGLRILVLEDEFLIAMDVEQLCLDHGAESVSVARSLEEAGASGEYDAAIVDLMLSGTSTFDFAETLKAAAKPFVFATGYTDNTDVMERFPGVALVGKPYSGTDLVEALALACGRTPVPKGSLPD